MRLALDTNLISHRTPRELLHGVAIEREFPLVVLPEVLEETLVRVRKVEERRVDRLLAEDARWMYADGRLGMAAPIACRGANRGGAGTVIGWSQRSREQASTELQDGCLGL